MSHVSSQLSVAQFCPVVWKKTTSTAATSGDDVLMDVGREFEARGTCTTGTFNFLFYQPTYSYPLQIRPG